MAYIYRIWNDINSKDYIGKTLNTIENRWKEHCSDYKRSRCEKRPLYEAMNKYGIEHFHIEQIEECSSDLLSEREIFWIEYYNSFKEGYNATKGGDGVSYVNSEYINQLWNEGKDINQIHNISGYDNQTITNHLKDKGITTKDIIERRQEKQRKKVLQIDKNTNEIVNEFDSIMAAARFIGKNTHHISEVCNGKRKTAYGYKWKFVE